MTDLFHGLSINHPNGDIPGERVDFGWHAWTSRAPKAKDGHWYRLRFYYQLWQFFGQQQVLIQVDDHYLMATSARVTANDEHGIEVHVAQHTNIIRHFLCYSLWRRSSPFQHTLYGREVHISAPQHDRPAELKHCPDALLDGNSALSLPVHIHCHQ